MNREELLAQFDWIEYDGQMDSDVTYFFAAQEPVGRLRGRSDILYIGMTERAIRVRYEEETRTVNSPKNRQNTSIRTTHVYRALCLDSPTCYYTKTLNVELNGTEKARFLNKLMNWDKRFFLKQDELATLLVPLEKYLLVQYADEHLEVPPLNNSM